MGKVSENPPETMTHEMKEQTACLHQDPHPPHTTLQNRKGKGRRGDVKLNLEKIYWYILIRDMVRGGFTSVHNVVLDEKVSADVLCASVSACKRNAR